MAEIIWNDAYNIGISDIDIQHKKLISILNDLYKANTKESSQKTIFDAIDKLMDYTNYHFSLEQQMHHDYKYPGSVKHQKEHQEFIDKIKVLKLEAEKQNLLTSFKTVDFLKDWIITHILGSDRLFGDYLREVELQ
jgi:hemerythrin-like metal-binding protein